MPTHKVKGGYKWGKSGKVYPTKSQADKQGQAIYANGWRGHTNENITKNTVRITKNDFNKIVKESIEKILGYILNN